MVKVDWRYFNPYIPEVTSTISWGTLKIVFDIDELIKNTSIFVKDGKKIVLFATLDWSKETPQFQIHRQGSVDKMINTGIKCPNCGHLEEDDYLERD